MNKDYKIFDSATNDYVQIIREFTVRFNTVRTEVSSLSEKYKIYGETDGWKYDNPIGEASIFYGRKTFVEIYVNEDAYLHKNWDCTHFHLIQFINHDIIDSYSDKIEEVNYRICGKNYFSRYFTDMELLRSEKEAN